MDYNIHSDLIHRILCLTLERHQLIDCKLPVFTRNIPSTGVTIDALRDDNHAARRHLALYNANTNWIYNS